MSLEIINLFSLLPLKFYLYFTTYLSKRDSAVQPSFTSLTHYLAKEEEIALSLSIPIDFPQKSFFFILHIIIDLIDYVSL